MLRTHTCGELTAKDQKKEVRLAGWVQSRRDHGGLIFIDLRDRYGLTQIVFDPKDKKSFSDAESLRREDVINVKGTVVSRKKGMENDNLSTGKIEVAVSKLDILNRAETPPIEIDDRVEANEDMRLKYRYLDLRRPVMQKKLIMRHVAAQATREYLSSQGFLEIETPLLIRATPEGARDYVVPSRVHPSKFYSLPQSPQLYKQISMVAGFDRYFQLPKCLRDEDLRADRQPEFTQIDIEMSFLEEKDIYEICEGLMKHIWKKALNVDLKIPFPKMTYVEAMARFGIDKPDMRFGLELIDVSEIAKKSDFEVFKKAEHIGCLNPEKDFGRKDLDRYLGYCMKEGAKGMAWVKVTDKGFEGSVAKYFSADIQKKLIEKTKAKKGSTLMFIADKYMAAVEILGKLRLKLGSDLNLIKKNEFKFIWVTRFPLFEWKEEEQKWSPMHHIFSMPCADCIEHIETDPGKVYGILYDLALNGTELGGGSIRIHRKDLQEKVLKAIGMDYKEAEQRFGFLLNAFKYGAPPHGGIAFGLDRVCALLNGTNDIREVIAYPKNKAAECPMDGCPTDIDDQQMKELHIKTEKVKSK